MTVLSEKEIVAGLNKLGIHSDPEIDTFLKEYKEYCMGGGSVHPQISYQNSKLDQRTFAKRFNKACFSAVAFLVHILPISKVKVQHANRR